MLLMGLWVVVLFTVEATYNGKPVKPGIVMTSGEDISAGKLEAEIYTTNGTPWDLAGVIGGPRGTKQYIPTPDFKKYEMKKIKLQYGILRKLLKQ